MAHTVWKGAVRFGLVTIPVKAHVATRDQGIHFMQVHKEDHQRIRMKRVCPEHGEVDYEEVGKAYPIGDQAVIVDREELRELAPERSEGIEVETIVPLQQVDPVYFDRTYHLVPEGIGVKAYRLLVETLRDSGQAAVGRVVLRNREHLVALRVWKDALVMETLHFADEVEPPAPLPEGQAPSKKELSMAKKLLSSMVDDFDPEQFHDEYREKVIELIEAKAKGGSVEIKQRPRQEVVDLGQALERSLEAVEA